MSPPVNQCRLLTDSVTGTRDNGCVNYNISVKLSKVVRVVPVLASVSTHLGLKNHSTTCMKPKFQKPHAVDLRIHKAVLTCDD